MKVRLPYALALFLVTACSMPVLVDTKQETFPNGFATIYTTFVTSPSGEECMSGAIHYYKWHKRAEPQDVVINGPPYFAAPGKHTVGVLCPAGYSRTTGNCKIWIGELPDNDLEIDVVAGGTYIVDCHSDGTPYIETQASWRAKHSKPDSAIRSNQPLHPTPPAAEAPASGAGERRR